MATLMKTERHSTGDIDAGRGVSDDALTSAGGGV